MLGILFIMTLNSKNIPGITNSIAPMTKIRKTNEINVAIIERLIPYLWLHFNTKGSNR